MRQRTDIWHARRVAILVFVTGCLLTLALVFHQYQRSTQFVSARFSVLSDRLSTRLQQRLRGYEQGLRGTRSAFLAVGVDRMTLERFRVVSSSRDPDTEFPGVRGFGYIQRVPAGGDAAFLQGLEPRGLGGLQLRELSENAGERFVIIFIEPHAGNEQAIGLDIGSEINRRQAMREAMRTGQATLTHPITLVQATGKVSQGFLLLLPVYPDHRVPGSPEERELVAVGAAYSPLLIDEVLADFELAAEGIALQLQDLGEDGVYRTFFGSGSAAPEAADLLAVRDFRIFGRNWRAQFHALPGFVSSLGGSFLPLLAGGGVLMSILLALLAHRICRDRSHQRRLRDSEQRLSLFIEHAPAALAMLDRDLCYVAVSRRWLLDYDLSGQILLGRSHYEVFPEVGAQWQAIHQRALAGEVVRAEEDAFVRGDGRTQWLRWEVRPWYEVGGAVGGLLIFSEDITSLKEVGDRIRNLNATLEAQVRERTIELEAARRSLRAVLDAVPSMIGYWDRNLINQVANHAYARWFGIDPAQVPGRHIRELLGEELYAQNLPCIEAVLRGEPQVFQRAIPRPDGSGARHSLAYYLPDIVDGEVCGFHVIVHDVTELTESRERLAATLRENEMLLRSIDKQLIYSVTDARGRIVAVNDRFCEVSGYRREELLGRTHQLLDAGVHDQAFWQGMWNELLAGRSWRGDICNRRRNGELFWVDSVIAPLVDSDGAIERIVALRYDITLSRRVLQELQEAKLQAERANQAKSAFVANTSHEIRTPLNAIIGMIYLLERTPLNADQRQQLAAIQLASRTLLELINDLLDLAKIESGELQFELQPLRLEEILAAVRQMFQTQAADKGLQLEFAALPLLPQPLLGDALRLRQVLTNLVGNALKFTQHGRVSVRVAPLAGTAGPLWLRFEVEDTGEGIAAELLEHLFRPFSQADSSITRRHGGTGLGLSIVRQLVEGMGGRVGLHSEAGHGSLFWFELPFESAAQVPGAPCALGAGSPAQGPQLDATCRWLPGVRVLVVDDSALNLDVCRRILEMQGAIVSLCLNGQKALEILGRAPEYFDVVLMDVLMPVMDGFTATRQIRSQPALAALPVIALTAGVGSERVAQALAAGMNLVLPKPLEPERLVRSIRHCIEEQWGCRVPVERILAQAGQGVSAELPVIPGVEVAQALQRLQCDLAGYAGILQRFVAAHAHLPDELQSLLRVGRAGQAAELLHRVRGVAGNLGAMALAMAAGELEEQLLAGDSLEPGSLESFVALHSELVAALSAWLAQRAA